VTERFLTVNEVAVMLRRTPRTIYRWLDKGTMFSRARKVKDGWLIPESDVFRLVNGAEDELSSSTIVSRA